VGWCERRHGWTVGRGSAPLLWWDGRMVCLVQALFLLKKARLIRFPLRRAEVFPGCESVNVMLAR